MCCISHDYIVDCVTLSRVFKARLPRFARNDALGTWGSPQSLTLLRNDALDQRSGF